VRWEMRTRLFLRTAEFLWQEGHTAHATAQEAIEETRKMLDVYAEFAEKWMALPVIKGSKTESERFAGALDTMCIEALMQDGKAQDQNGEVAYAWTTSWGVSTRLIGALIMSHSDDDGLVLPPRLAPTHVVILPIYRDEAQRAEVLAYCETLKADLKKQMYDESAVRVDVDDRDLRGGEKKWYHVKRGVPLRVEVGPKDIANNSVFVGRRDTNESQGISRDEFVTKVSSLLEEIQTSLYNRALALRESRTQEIGSESEFRKYFGGNPGFAVCWFSSEEEVQPLLDELKVTIRCIPVDSSGGEGKCFLTGKSTNQRAIFAKAY